MVTSEISDGRPTSISTETALNIAESLITYREKASSPFRVDLALIGDLVGGGRAVDDTSLKVINDALAKSGLTFMVANDSLYVVSEPEFDLYNGLVSAEDEIHLYRFSE